MSESREALHRVNRQRDEVIESFQRFWDKAVASGDIAFWIRELPSVPGVTFFWHQGHWGVIGLESLSPELWVIVREYIEDVVAKRWDGRKLV
jgi:hypothetical protein